MTSASTRYCATLCESSKRKNIRTKNSILYSIITECIDFQRTIHARYMYILIKQSIYNIMPFCYLDPPSLRDILVRRLSCVIIANSNNC